MLLKKEEASKNALLSQLKKIDEHLGKRGQRFLTGDTMCCFDCELMPRLQHIRVAGLIAKHKHGSGSSCFIEFVFLFSVFLSSTDNRQILYGFRHSDVIDPFVALHVQHVPFGRLHPGTLVFSTFP